MVQEISWSNNVIAFLIEMAGRHIMNLFTAMIPDMTGNVAGRMGAHAIAIVLTGMGIALVAESVGSLVQELGQIQDETTKNEEISIQLRDEVRRFKKV